MDTIVAVATPPGRSAIGMLRMSGPDAVDILRFLVNDPQLEPTPNQVVLKEIRMAGSNEGLDHALVSYFRSPHSYTGEDMVEISCHGSPVIMRQLLDLIQSRGGRLAGPGEFTLRACKNGKLNLSQAEAIRDLINARTMVAAKQASRQLRGELSKALESCKSDLIHVIVVLESALEFVEDDLPQVQIDEVTNRLKGVLQTLKNLAGTYSAGHLLREGLRVTIVGRPNVGKSSVFNKLVKLNRAIVTEVPGTTRDTISESISIDGVPITLTDTAGLRDTLELVEAIGVERTRQAIVDADLLLIVIDGSMELTEEDYLVLREAATATHVIAVNKCDLPTATAWNDELKVESESVVHVSALTGAGVAELSAAILNPFSGRDSSSNGLLITDSRHHDLLVRAAQSVGESLRLLEDDASEELVLVGLHNALKFLGEITGETTSEDILGEIFSTFCIGK
jgi:tRNA modification GTPase